MTDPQNIVGVAGNQIRVISCSQVETVPQLGVLRRYSGVEVADDLTTHTSHTQPKLQLLVRLSSSAHCREMKY